MDNPNLKPMVFIQKTKTTINKLRKKNYPRIFNAMNVFFFILAILCGRATLFSSMRPFGGAFFASIFSKKGGYLYILAALIGQISSGAPLYEAGKYLFAMTFFAVVIDRLPPHAGKNPFIRGGIFAFTLAISGGFFAFASGEGVIFSTYYDIMFLLVECAVAFAAVAAFMGAIPIIRKMKLSYTFSSAEEISLVTLLGCALWGAKDITNIFVFNLSDILCLLIIIVFSVRLGTGKGVIAGLIMGLVSSLGSGRIDVSCVSYAFSALTASLLGKYGAIPACSGFILANALVTALANGSTEVLISIFDIFAACALYSLIPEKVLLYLTNFGARDEKDRIASDERTYSGFVLMNTQNAVKSLLNRITKLEEKRQTKNETELHFFERLTRRSCQGCGMRRLCWSRDIQKTTRNMQEALSAYIEDGKIPDASLPENCIRPKELREAFLFVSEIYRTDLMWQGKLKEVKNASLKQAEAFLEILHGTQKTLSFSQSFDRALSDSILRRLTEENVKCNSVVVMRDDDNDPTVMLSLSSCGGFSLCEKGALEIVSSACGQEMVRAGKKDCTKCNIKYVPAPPTRVNFSFSKKSRDGKKVSGDSVLFRIINKSLYAAVLCDGMGSGEKAFLEARSSAETLLDLIEAGVDGEKAIEITSSLLLPLGETTFSATDLCLYDARTQKARIIKCGSAASFTKTGDRVDAYYSRSMPIGAFTKSDIETFTLSSRSGDIIVMISDGVLESAAEGAMKDGWLIREIENFQGSDPSRLADLIVEKAMEKCSFNPHDDITVLTAVIE